MKFKFLNAALLSSTMLISCMVNIANAGVITLGSNHNDYYLSNDSTYNVISRVADDYEYMHLDQTIGSSIDGALADHGGNGWGLASTLQFSNLMNSFFGGIHWDDDNTTGQHTDTMAINSTIMSWINVFGGDTLLPATANRSEYYLGNVLFGTPLDIGTGELFESFVYSSIRNYANGAVSDPYAGVTNATYDSSFSASRFSVLLIRDKNVNPQLVPEPSTLAIFALGMMALVSRRFKKQS
jgi:hypothetical protein